LKSAGRRWRRGGSSESTAAIGALEVLVGAGAAALGRRVDARRRRARPWSTSGEVALTAAIWGTAEPPNAAAVEFAHQVAGEHAGREDVAAERHRGRARAPGRQRTRPPIAAPGRSIRAPQPGIRLITISYKCQLT
jgi:hypothetical protein